jgi:integrase
MPSRARKPKAVKGTVQVKASNERLQLVFTHAGQRYYLSPGYPDTPKYWRAAERKAAIIEEDIEKDRFDPTLDKYRPEPKFVLKQEAIDAKPSLLKLWNSFMEFKRPQCSPSTMYKQYGTFTNYLAALPTHDLDKGLRDP